MSNESVAVVRAVVAAFNERDFPTLETLFADEFDLRIVGGIADMTGTEFRGKQSAIGWIKDLVETIGGFLHVEMLRQIGDQMLLTATLQTSGTTSGAPATWRIGQVYSVRDGRITALNSYYTADEALKAVGLEE